MKYDNLVKICNSIKSCPNLNKSNKYCGRDDNAKPKIVDVRKNQRLMLITSDPSNEANRYESVTVKENKFFKNKILPILFEDYSDANFDSFREKFLNLFYWTHYQKCFPGITDKGAHKQPKTKCAPEYLEEEIRAAEPEYIIAMGSHAVKFITKNNLIDAIYRNRNSPILFDDKIPIISITHPSDANNGAKHNEKDYKYEDSIKLIKEIVSNYK